MNPFRALWKRWRARREAIPEAFHSFEADGPFCQCSVCGGDLASASFGYLIQKTYAGDRLIFECAVCTACCVDLSEELSKDSRKNVQQYVDQHRRDRGNMTRCHFCLQPLLELTEHTQVIDCKQGQMLVWEYPLILCGACEMGLYEVLSKTTRDAHDRWVDEYFGVPPGLGQDLPEGTPSQQPRKPLLI